jgi:ferredoxin
MGKLAYLKNVVTLALDSRKCSGCGMCLEVCPHEVFEMNGKGVLIRDRDACMECGACSRNCPTGALTVQSGVGCAAAVINGMLGRNATGCCCVVDSNEPSKPGSCGGGGCC